MKSNERSEFEAFLDATGPVKRLSLEVGDKVSAKIVHLSKDTAFLALDAQNEAMIPLVDLEEPEVGKTIEASVASVGDQIWLTVKGTKNAGDVGSLVEGKVTNARSGGVEVDVGGQRAFCPIGQLDIGYVEDPKEFVGRTLSFIVSQSTAKNLTLNRKSLLQKQRAEKMREILANLKVGDQVDVPVSRTAEFGVFVDLGGGVEGLIPQSELGFGKISVGDKVTAQVMKIEPDYKRPGQMRIVLSLRAAFPDPFETYASQLVPGAQIEGIVARLENYGAFVSLFPGLDGLIHISELSTKRIKHPDQIVKAGDKVNARILDVDPVSKRVALSLKDPDADAAGKAIPKMESERSLGSLGDLMKAGKS
ncbi:MAG: S1 RNA-binding domain-containing protein [Deltaproteobacteria bacterium]|nr:S1 RNA-binding domain-containing protein [Deltaproteobacteria bacterium]